MNRLITMFVAVTICGLLTVHPGVVRAQAAPGRSALLLPGDAVTIQVYNRPELSGTFDIDELGRIQHPLYSTLRVTGQSLDQLEASLQSFLKAYDNEPRFVVRSMMKIFVEGQVARPNIYRVPAPTTVTEAIALAGGTTGRPDLERVVLQRGGISKIYDIRNVDIREASLVLQSGDRVIVRQRKSLIRDLLIPTMSLASGVYSILRVVRILKS
jgi:protein involved in polysaccharide export with SLBB domain